MSEKPLATHIHQFQCIVPVPHETHILELGVYNNTEYIYRCLGKD